jgi:hypothetical protein
MIIINLKNIIESKSIYIHDSVIKSVVCDYINQTVKVGLDVTGVSGLGESGIKTAIIEFNKVKTESLSFFHPWGKGIWIASLEINRNIPKIINLPKGDDLTNSFLTTFILTSGDKLEIVAESLKFKTRK